MQAIYDLELLDDTTEFNQHILKLKNYEELQKVIIDYNQDEKKNYDRIKTKFLIELKTKNYNFVNNTYGMNLKYKEINEIINEAFENEYFFNFNSINYNI